MDTNTLDAEHSKKELNEQVKETIYSSISPLLNGITPSGHFKKSVKKASKEISAAILKEVKHILKKEKKKSGKEVPAPSPNNSTSSEKKDTGAAVLKKAVAASRPSKKPVKKAAKKAGTQPTNKKTQPTASPENPATH